MKLLGGITLILCQIASSLASCFVPEETGDVKKPITMAAKDTQRECERQCETIEQCVSIKYNATSKVCTLQQAEDVQSCNEKYTRYVKVGPTGAPKRKDYMAEMGTDPCVTKYRPEFTSFDAPNVCQVRDLNGADGPVLALRGLLENGTRVTLSDENAATVSYEACTDTWVYDITYDDVNVQIRLHAVVCAEFDNAKCPCSPLTYPNETKPYTDVEVNKNPACPGWTDVRHLYWKLNIGYPEKTVIACKAGEWFAANMNNPPEKQSALIVHAGCPPS